MSLYFQVLASGSRGNAILVSSSTTTILIDAGLSGRELIRRLSLTPLSPRCLNALVISHEHADHIKGMGVISRKLDLPVYLTQGTLEKIPPGVGELASTLVFQPGNSFHVGDLKITSFPVSHDARQPVGFVIEQDHSRLGICTDLGFATHLVRSRLQACNALILEANHDTRMLLKGPYPPFLKQRIRSRHGHLSNAQTCALLPRLYHEDLKIVILAHLSEINNHPKKVKESLRQMPNSCYWEEVHFEIAKQDEVGPGFEI